MILCVGVDLGGGHGGEGGDVGVGVRADGGGSWCWWWVLEYPRFSFRPNSFWGLVLVCADFKDIITNC